MGQYRHNSLTLIRVDPAAVLCQNSVAPRADRIILRLSCRKVQGRHEIIIPQDEEPGMGMESPQSQSVRAGQIPHRWTRVQDPGTESVVAAFESVVVGGGPAGLTGAYELTRHGRTCVVLEADPRMVGGISRTD